jgi:hypothetical protein
MITLRCYCNIGHKRLRIALNVGNVDDRLINKLINHPSAIQSKLCALTGNNNIVCNDVIPIEYCPSNERINTINIFHAKFEI